MQKELSELSSIDDKLECAIIDVVNFVKKRLGDNLNSISVVEEIFNLRDTGIFNGLNKLAPKGRNIFAEALLSILEEF